ncbi:MAG: hypothetical protein J5367_07580, partial [Lachnospiraceae bacterium]|nr:hypothetical protein [Lachnospiraceae bacterium]
MTFDDIENLISLFFTIIGLLMCLFKYITNSKRRYLFLIAFFSLRFLSDYYWSVYQLVVGDTPNIKNYVSNLGWDIGYAVLLFIVIRYQKSAGKRFFHPLMLWPVLTNIPQLILYLPYDALWINLWEVSVTTLIMIFCMKDIIWCYKNRKSGTYTPHLAVLVLITHISEYGMWTTSCFDWGSELKSPYFYLNIISSISVIFYAWAMEADDESDAVLAGGNELEQRNLATVQAILALVIFGGCFAGYYITQNIRASLPDIEDVENYSGELILILLGISVVVVLMMLAILH